MIHDYAGHPFQVQLSRALAARGHDVLHLYAGQLQTPRGALARRTSDPERFSIRAVDIGEPIQKYNFVKRRSQEIRYGKLVARVVEEFRPDVVLSSNTNLDAQARILKAVRRIDGQFYFWLQDLLGVAAVRILADKYGSPGRFIGAAYARKERNLLRESDGVVGITEDFVPLLSGWGVEPSRIHTIPNWAPIEEMPTRPRDNPWSRMHGLVDATVFLYSGTLGLKHDPELLVKLAEAAKRLPDARVVVVSEGLGADHIRRRVAELGLSNVLILPFQPFEQLPDVLGSADVLLAILEPDAGIFSVPSKVLSYLCAGRALVLAVPSENLASRIVAGAGAGALVPPGDADAFVTAALRFAAVPEARAEAAKRARAYAEETFDIGRIASAFERVLAQGANGTSGGAPTPEH